ncbi:MAG: DUF680 domain-containing protein [Mesorhizobium sp.]|nr:DUF680 domain-containing protein [Mesorhizobium sp.]
MKKIALATAALLIASGTAFAGSDHYGSEDTLPQANSVDSSYTASIPQKVKKVQQDNTRDRATNQIQEQFRH